MPEDSPQVHLPTSSDHGVARHRGVADEITQRAREDATDILTRIMPESLPIIPESVGWHLASEHMAQGGALLFAEIADAPGQEAIFTPGEPKIIIAKVLFRDPNSENITDWRNREIAQTAKAGRVAGDGVIQTIATSLILNPDDSIGLLVFKWYPNGSLQERLLNETMNRDQILSFNERSGNAIAKLYNQKPPITHRDVKPRNFLVDYTGNADLADFDIASSVWKGDAFGEPPYAAPEAILHESIGTKADVYALGVTAYQMIVGDLSQSPYGNYDATYQSLDSQTRHERLNELIEIRNSKKEPSEQWTYRPITLTPELEARGFTQATIDAVNPVLANAVHLMDHERLDMPSFTQQMTSALSVI